jgi:hypothetical protein
MFEHILLAFFLMAVGIQDLPDELALLVLEFGCLEIPRYWPSRSDYISDASTPWPSFNAALTRRRKPFCNQMAAVSKFWFGLIEDTKSCWFLPIVFAGVSFPFKYDIATELAKCMANLRTSPGCDITVTIGDGASAINTDLQPLYFPPEDGHVVPTSDREVVGMQTRLLLQIVTKLKPYSNRIIRFHLLHHDYNTMAFILEHLHSFGPMPRLREAEFCSRIVDWPWRSGPIDTINFESYSTPLLGLRSPHCIQPGTNNVNLLDLALLSGVQKLTVSLIGSATRLPQNLTELEIRIWNRREISSVTWQTMETVLIQCPRLHRLSVSFHANTASFITPTWKNIILHSLQSLTLGVTDLEIWTFLTRCSLPNLQKLALYLPFYDRRSSSVLPHFLTVQNPPSISLPSLREASCAVTSNIFPSLHFIRTPTLESVAYTLNPADNPNAEPVPEISLKAAPTSARMIVISIVSPDMLHFPPLAQLVAQHDLSATEHVIINGPVPHYFDRHPGDHEPCNKLFQAGVTYLANHSVPPLPRLRQLTLTRMHCTHMAETLMLLFSKAGSLTCLTLDYLEESNACGHHMFEQHRGMTEMLKLPWFSCVASIEPLLHPLTAFSHIRVLMLEICCTYYGGPSCTYLQESALDNALRSVANATPLSSLPFLGQLVVEVYIEHTSELHPGQLYAWPRKRINKPGHPPPKILISKVLAAVRCSLLSRRNLGVQDVEEVYLLVKSLPEPFIRRVSINRVLYRVR